MANYEKINPLMKKDLNLSYNQFREQYPKAKLSDNTYYKRRAELKKEVDSDPKNSTVDYDFLDNILKKDLNMTYAAFIAAYPHVQLSDASFYTRRKMLATGASDQWSCKKKTKTIDYSVVDDALKENPELTYIEFSKAFPEFKISDAAFYARRRKRTGKRSYTRSATPSAKIYMQVMSISTEALKNDPMSLINDIIAGINKAYNLRLETVELNNPSQIEIRELKK